MDDEGNVIINNSGKEKKDDDYDDWEICEGEEVMSINMDNEKYQDDFLKEFEIIENYDDNNQEVTKSKKIEI